MKFCAKCGNELADDAQICMNCGCAVGVPKSNAVTPKAKKLSGKKKTVLIIITAVLAVALLVGVYFLVNYIRAVDVVNDLSGESFMYRDSDYFGYTRKEVVFDENGELTYSYYYSNIDAGGEYGLDYQVKFKNNMIILEAGLVNEFEVRYDKYGRVEGLYDITYSELYE